ncbi:hypothetical protein FN846DRAFT_129084 [Sphaerosporella brunnea]|uniref:Uncharacterized protein n=1 Tax=Sphaerosporella brunnea TaxID=1250544 RepID=A0A5J5F955_9PEZI|nr:hypothetical protein FN846DRAFT_129084 [Sphaerosporella brunnea]
MTLPVDGSCDGELSVKGIPKEDLIIGDWHRESDQTRESHDEINPDNDDAAAVEFVGPDEQDQQTLPPLGPRPPPSPPPRQPQQTNPLWDVPARAHALGEPLKETPQKPPPQKKNNYRQQRYLPPDDDLWDIPASAHASGKISTPRSSAAFWWSQKAWKNPV